MQTFSSCNLKQIKLSKSSFKGEVFNYFSCISCVVYTKAIIRHIVVDNCIYIYQVGEPNL